MIVILYAGLLVSASPAQETLAASSSTGYITTTARVRSKRPRSRADDIILAQRLEDAALKVCGAPDGSLREVRSAVARSTCFVDARRKAFRDAGLTSEMPRRDGRFNKR